MALILITGSTDGLGRAAATSLIEQGHDVVLHARSPERAKALGEFGRQAAGVVTGDLSRLAEIRGVAEQANAIGRMDAVIHNAGVYTEPSRGPAPDGHARTLTVNTVAPYMLTALMERPDRLIYLSSGLHRGGEGSLEDIDWVKRRWDPGKVYAETKLQLVALAFALARRWPEVLSHAVDPGWVRTRMGGAAAPVDIDTGQRTQAWLAVSDDPRVLVSGQYWHNQQAEEPADEARNESFQDRLIGELERLTGVPLP